MFNIWRDKWDGRERTKSAAQRRREARARQARRRYLRCEFLEDRRLLAALAVNTNNDVLDGDTSSITNLLAGPGADGLISLREAITAANSTGGADSITFGDGSGSGGTNFLDATPDTITLGGTELPIIIEALTITGTGAANLTIDANALSRIFNINDGNGTNQVSVELVAMTLTGGRANGSFPNDRGGAIFTKENLTLRDSVITGSNATQVGGGVYSRTYNGGTTTIRNSTLSGNSAGNRGGALFAQAVNGSATMIQNSTIAGNTALTQGGGIFSLTSAGGTTTIQNSTLSGNSTSSFGGGIYSRNFGTTIIQNSTLSGNTSSNSGGIISFNYGTLNLISSIVAGNTNSSASVPPDFGSYGSVAATVITSLIGDNTGSGLSEAQPPTPDANGNFVGTTANPVDSLVGPLANNGGPTQTMALLANSPALNLGSNPASLTSDQRGFPFLRDDGSGVDMGAYEVQSLALLVDIANDVDNGNYAPGDLSLREAVSLANANPGADTIGFDTAGVFATPQTITLGGTELPIIIEALTITGTGAANLTIDANNLSRIFNIDDGNNSNHVAVELVAMTLTGGNAAGDGGAINNRESLTVSDSIISGNSASGFGGGIFAAARSLMTIQDSTLSGNTAGGAGGGLAVRTYLGGTATIQNSTLSGNTAGTNGGAMFSRNYSGGATVIENSTISGNSGYSGGGISAQALGGSATIRSTTVSGNTANVGGGMILQSSATGTVTIQNSTLSGNSAVVRGGGIYSVNTGGTEILQNSTISGNTAAQGGGIYSYLSGTASLASSIVAGNTATTTAPDFRLNLISGSATVTNSLIGDNTGSGLAEAQTPDGNGNLVGDPMGGGVIAPRLGPLANNGGPTQTRALLAGSPALDRGSNPASLTTDQRGVGYARGVDGADADTVAQVDMGALEQHPSVEDLADQTIDEDNSLNTSFHVGDATLTAGIDTITVTSSNTTLVPNANINVGGSGNNTLSNSTNANQSLVITPAAGLFGTTTITLTVTDTVAGTPRTMTDTFVLTVAPVADTPSVTNASTTLNTQTTSGLVISRNGVDNAEVTHFKITNITGGTLFQNNGSTQIVNNEFITVAQGAAGLKFTPTNGSFATGHFTVQAALSNSNGGLGGGTVTADIAVTAFDFGDAPAPYPTLLASNGARHTLGSGLFLGATVDAEVNGQPNAAATGDDVTGAPDDEDGVVFGASLIAGQNGSVSVTASAAGQLNAWIDFNNNGSWSDTGEQIFTNRLLAVGVNNLTFAIPVTSPVGVNRPARFRLNGTGGLSINGLASDGEVEDYQVTIATTTEKIGIHRSNQFYQDVNGNGVWNGNAGGDRLVSFGNPGDVPLVGDWNGDGFDEVGVKRSNQYYLDANGNGVWNGPAGGDLFFTFGNGSDVPLVGDWDGDGDDQIGVQRANQFYLDFNSNGVWNGVAGGDVLYAFGNSGDVPLVGDWDGDGDDQIGIHRGSQFYLDRNGNGVWNNVAGGDRLFNFGASGDTPITGDWNANGVDEIGVQRGNQFYRDNNGNGIWNGTAGGDLLHNFGNPGDRPLDGKWRPIGALLAAEGAAPTSDNVQRLTLDALPAIVEQAIVLWAKTGLASAQVQSLERVTFSIADLPGALLGLSLGGTILLDTDAAGYGWFVDPTPADSSEFSNSPITNPQSLDLLSAILHELGHELGFDHDDDVAAMFETLAVGTRRLL